MSQIRLESLSMSFGATPVLKGVDLTVEHGEMVALVGPSGSGKTTLLKLIAALLEPTEGTIRFDGAEVNTQSTRERGAVVVFQEYSLFPHLTVEENIAFGLKMRGVGKAERSRRANALLGLVQLEGCGGRYPRELSGGQRQRVAMARALAVEPRVLLLDEPFSNLDAALRDNLRDFVRQLQKRLGITCLLVTHDTQDALMTADRIAVLSEGRIEQCDTPQGIYRTPGSRRVADFFGPANYERVRVEGGQVFSRFGRWSLPTAHEGAADLMVRPENLKLSDDRDSGAEVTVADAVFCGERTACTVLLDGAEYRVADAGRRLWKAGDRASLILESEGLCLFDPGSGRRL